MACFQMNNSYTIQVLSNRWVTEFGSSEGNVSAKIACGNQGRSNIEASAELKIQRLLALVSAPGGFSKCKCSQGGNFLIQGSQHLLSGKGIYQIEKQS